MVDGVSTSSLHGPPSAFALLGLPERFDLSPSAVQKAYLARASRVHPDREGLQEGGAGEQAAELNAARATLMDPEKRARALLALLGAGGRVDGVAVPPAVLMDMLERREELEAALNKGDAEAITTLAQWARARREAHVSKLTELFAQARALANDQRGSVLQAIQSELNAQRYIEQMLLRLAQAEH